VLKILARETRRDWYSCAEVAGQFQKSEYTVREYCRLGRLKADKRQSGRGSSKEWVISHEELERYRREGLRPFHLGA